MLTLKAIEKWRDNRNKTDKKSVFAVNRYIFPDIVKRLVDCTDIAYISIGETEDCIDFYHYENYGHYLDSSSRVLNVDFDDVTNDEINGSYIFRAITEKQAQIICQFIMNNKDKHIICHCRAGKSRSQGVVRAILDCYPDIYTECSINSINPCLTPNYEVVRKIKREIYNFS